MLVYNKQLGEGMFVSVFIFRPQRDKQRNVACNYSSNFKMLMSSAGPKNCITSFWERRVSTFLSCGMMGKISSYAK